MDTATPTAPKKSIAQMQQDLLKYRAGKLGLPDPTAAPTTTPDQTETDTTNESIGAALADYRKQKSAGTLPKTEIPKDDPNKLVSFAKSIFSAPATLVARPFQAVAELAGADSSDVDAFSSKISGGLIAPVPQNFKDVEKDVGRAAETIALGTGAPIAGGALFGAGASLEAGNDLFSAQTAVDAVIGGAGGKVLEWVGKPLLNAAGKVVGTITPKIIKDVAAGGAEAIAKFAATHDLPLVGPISRPVSEGIARGTQAVDSAIGSGFKKGGAALRRTAAEQFPGLNPTDHYTRVNERDIVQPTKLNEPKYSKATAVYNDAKAKGIDLEKVATERGVIHDKIAEGGKYNTKDTAEGLRQGNYEVSDTILRPAIATAEYGVKRVPISEVRGQMLGQVNDIPASQITPEDRARMINSINKRYADGSAADVAHPNGFSLTDLHDNRIVSQKNGGYKIGQSSSDALKAQLSREEGKVFGRIFDRQAPAELGLAGFRKELEKNFFLADYLESLHGKKIPEGITKRAVRLFGRAAAATFGGKIGGFPGAILGSQYGDMLFASFEALPNPIKMRVLQKVQIEQPEVFKALAEYIRAKGDELEKMLIRRLPAAGESTYKEPGSPTLFTTPGGVSTPDKGAAVDLTSVEKGNAKAPKTNRRLRSYLTKVQAAGEASEPYVPGGQLPVISTGRIPKRPDTLPVIKAGKPAKKLTDIYVD